MPESPWERVVWPDELPPCLGCGEPYCDTHEQHYDDCACLGPTEDGAEYRVVKGVLYGRRLEGGSDA